MDPARGLRAVTTGLGILSSLAIVLSHLALTDIGHAEGDLSLEWGVLRVSALVLAAFIVSTFVMLRATQRLQIES
jgi:hypothetical protein